MAKSLCKWKKKDIEKHFDDLTKLVSDPKYICKECARAAHSKSVLCKPAKIPCDPE